MCRGRRNSHAQPQGPRTSFDLWNGLLLVLGGSCCYRDRALRGALAENYHLFILGVLSLISATVARTALRQRWSNWVRLHITGMGFSYILMLTAFYVDNGKNLPLWKELPQDRKSTRLNSSH